MELQLPQPLPDIACIMECCNVLCTVNALLHLQNGTPIMTIMLQCTESYRKVIIIRSTKY